MKLAFFDDYKLGVVKGDSIVDVSAAVRDIPHLGPHDLINGLIARFGDYKKQPGGCGRQPARACRSPACACARRCRSRATSSAWR